MGGGSLAVGGELDLRVGGDGRLGQGDGTCGKSAQEFVDVASEGSCIRCCCLLLSNNHGEPPLEAADMLGERGLGG